MSDIAEEDYNCNIRRYVDICQIKSELLHLKLMRI